MTTQFSTTARNAALDAIETVIGASPIMKVRSGAPPANCASADSGTVLATLNLPADFMANASGGTKAAQGTWQDSSADASGETGHYRIYDSTGVTCHEQGLVSAPWQASKAYVIGSTVHNGGNVYRATAAGTSSGTGPTHTSGSAADGGVTCLFVQTGTDMTVDNGTLVTGQPFNVTSKTLTAGGA